MARAGRQKSCGRAKSLPATRALAPWAVGQSPEQVRSAPLWAGPEFVGAEAGPGSPRRGRGRARALRAGGGPGWRTGATGAPATKGCDPHWLRLPGCGPANQSGFYWRVGRAGPAAPRLWHGNVPARGWWGPQRSLSAPAARAGAGGSGRPSGVPGTPREGEWHEGLERGAREGGWGRRFWEKGWGRP